MRQHRIQIEILKEVLRQCGNMKVENINDTDWIDGHNHGIEMCLENTGAIITRLQGKRR